MLSKYLFDYGQFEGSQGYWLEVSDGNDIISYQVFNSLRGLHNEINRRKRMRKVLGIVRNVMNREAAINDELQSKDVRRLFNR